MWYTPITVGTVLIVGLIVSYITGPLKPNEVDPKLLIPVIDNFLGCLPRSVQARLGYTRKESDSTKVDASFTLSDKNTLIVNILPRLEMMLRWSFSIQLIWLAKSVRDPMWFLQSHCLPTVSVLTTMVPSRTDQTEKLADDHYRRMMVNKEQRISFIRCFLRSSVILSDKHRKMTFVWLFHIFLQFSANK